MSDVVPIQVNLSKMIKEETGIDLSSPKDAVKVGVTGQTQGNKDEEGTLDTVAAALKREKHEEEEAKLFNAATGAYFLAETYFLEAYAGTPDAAIQKLSWERAAAAKDLGERYEIAAKSYEEAAES